MALPLEVLAELRLSVDGEDIDIRGTGDHIVVDLPSLRAGRRLLTSGPFVTNHAQTTDRIHETLRHSGLSAEVRLRGDPLARVGAGAQPGFLGQLLKLHGVDIRPVRPLRAALRRRPLLTTTVLVGLLVGFGWWLLRNRSG